MATPKETLSISTRNPQLAAESCGVANGVTDMPSSPITVSGSSGVRNRTAWGAQAAIPPNEAAGAYTGSSKCLHIISSPRIWSVCSWVTNTAFMFVSELPSEFSAVSHERAETPQSMRYSFFPFAKYTQFPSEDENRV